MTRKDYEMIARSLYADRDFLDKEDKWVIDYVAKGLCEQFEADNPRFNREKFLVASGVWQSCDVCGERMRYVTGQGQWCQAHLPEWAKKIKSQISSVA